MTDRKICLTCNAWKAKQGGKYGSIRRARPDILNVGICMVHKKSALSISKCDQWREYKPEPIHPDWRDGN